MTYAGEENLTWIIALIDWIENLNKSNRKIWGLIVTPTQELWIILFLTSSKYSINWKKLNIIEFKNLVVTPTWENRTLFLTYFLKSKSQKLTFPGTSPKSPQKEAFIKRGFVYLKSGHFGSFKFFFCRKETTLKHMFKSLCIYMGKDFI